MKTANRRAPKWLGIAISDQLGASRQAEPRTAAGRQVDPGELIEQEGAGEADGGGQRHPAAAMLEGLGEHGVGQQGRRSITSDRLGAVARVRPSHNRPSPGWALSRARRQQLEK
jgi:hypothetical protein